MSREEYEAIGKGDGYTPGQWQTTRPDDRTYPGTETPVDGSAEARAARSRASGKPRSVPSLPEGKGTASTEATASKS